LARGLQFLVGKPPGETCMASDSGSNTGVVAIFAIVLLAALAALVAWKMGVFGGGGGGGGAGSHKVIELKTP
jgi:hypothetical protein